MRQKGNTIIIVIVSIIILAALGFLFYQNSQLKKLITTPTSTTTPTSQASAIPSTTTPVSSPQSSLKPGWNLYQNSLYKFEFSHPSAFKVLTDSENLYGWPNAILLLYKGGQSYDMPVEIWNSEAEYKAKYPGSTQLTVFKTKDGKFITLNNANNDPEVEAIISTFKFTD